jgi:hypothetical protein
MWTASLGWFHSKPTEYRYLGAKKSLDTSVQQLCAMPPLAACLVIGVLISHLSEQQINTHVFWLAHNRCAPHQLVANIENVNGLRPITVT